jgi:protease-4
MRLEQSTMREILMAGIIEQRRARRWGIFFRFVLIVYVVSAMAIAIEPGAMSEGTDEPVAAAGVPHVAVVEISGVIDSKGLASARHINRALRRAFEHESTRAVILRVNSPGGSPVQSAMIYDEIRRLRAANSSVLVHAVIEDMGASGGYFVASAADQIHVNGASLVGSIGVRMDGFGFTGTMEKLGVERRLLTAGRDKGMLDPFSPSSPEHDAAAQAILDEVHREFITAVTAARGDRLKRDTDLFTGRLWSGGSAIEIGLADARGSVASVARDVVKIQKLVDFTDKETIVDRLGRRLGVSISSWFGLDEASGVWRLR